MPHAPTLDRTNLPNWATEPTGQAISISPAPIAYRGPVQHSEHARIHNLPADHEMPADALDGTRLEPQELRARPDPQRESLITTALLPRIGGVAVNSVAPRKRWFHALSSPSYSGRHRR